VQDSGKFSPESLFMVAGIIVEDILGNFFLKVPALREIETLGGVHYKLLNIGDQIKNCPKLQGANLYFSLDLTLFCLIS
jgi:hypothetical protein